MQPTKKFTKWLMKSEPESRFEKGVDVKVCISVACSNGVASLGLISRHSMLAFNIMYNRSLSIFCSLV